MWRRAFSNRLPAATLACVVACQNPNLISNGSFSQGSAPWAATALVAGGASSELEARLHDGALCVTLPGQHELILGWPTAGSPDQFSLAAGHRYQLSLRASTTSAALACVAKVGHQLPPYTAVSVAPMALTPSFQAFQFPFTAAHDDDRAGVAVECRAAPGSADVDVCIDDVVFVAL